PPQRVPRTPCPPPQRAWRLPRSPTHRAPARPAEPVRRPLQCWYRSPLPPPRNPSQPSSIELLDSSGDLLQLVGGQFRVDGQAQDLSRGALALGKVALTVAQL